MPGFDREVRAEVYAAFVEGEQSVDAALLSERSGRPHADVADALRRLDEQRQLVIVPETDRVWMAHPFSGVATSYVARIGASAWNANCAWDALAILGLLGDGGVERDGESLWSVSHGAVTPNGPVHFRVPARHFWVDIGFT